MPPFYPSATTAPRTRSTVRSSRQAGSGASGQAASHQQTCSVMAVGMRCGHSGQPLEVRALLQAVARRGRGAEERDRAGADRRGQAHRAGVGADDDPAGLRDGGELRGEAAEVGRRELLGALDGADREDRAGEGAAPAPPSGARASA